MNDSNNTGDGNTYRAVRIGDVADWRLLVSISDSAMGAWLKHDDPMRTIETVFTKSWNCDEEAILSNIENSVYDHPQVLDDFSSDIVITARKSLWVPTELIQDDDDEAERLFTQIYSVDPEDIMSETVGEATCLFSLTKGLNSFLQRTFPGTRLHSNLGVMVKRFSERSADMPRVYIDIRDGEADFIAFDRKALLMAASHSWLTPDDIKYHLFNILDVFGLDPGQVQVSLSGRGRVKTQLLAELREKIAFVMLTMIPSLGAKADLPLPVSLLLRK